MIPQTKDTEGIFDYYKNYVNERDVNVIIQLIYFLIFIRKVLELFFKKTNNYQTYQKINTIDKI